MADLTIVNNVTMTPADLRTAFFDDNITLRFEKDAPVDARFDVDGEEDVELLQFALKNAYYESCNQLLAVLKATLNETLGCAVSDEYKEARWQELKMSMGDISIYALNEDPAYLNQIKTHSDQTGN